MRLGSPLALALLALCVVARASTASAHAATQLPEGFQEITLADRLDLPVDATWAPDGRMFIAGRAGVVWVHNPEAATGDNQVIVDIRDHVHDAANSDHGLLGIATDSSFETNGYLYLLYTYDSGGADSLTDPMVSTLTRVTVHPDNSVVGGVQDPIETTLLGSVRPTSTDVSQPNGICGDVDGTTDCIPSEGVSHSIGTVISAPDGTIYAGTGDASNFTYIDRLSATAENPNTFRGKIIHIDRSGDGLPGHPFCPSDSDLTHICTKIYAAGLRNPYRFTLRPEGGLAIADVGQHAYEEVDLSNGGEDFGWPCYEGPVKTPYVDPSGHAYQEWQQCQDLYAQNTTVAPAFSVPHPSDGLDCRPDPPPTGETIIGAAIYGGDQYPAGYRGQFFFGNVGGWGGIGCGWVQRATISGNSLTGVTRFAIDWDGDVSIESAPDGNLVYVGLYEGTVKKIVYGPGNHRPTVVPHATPTGGAVPLRVQLEAGASDADGDPLTYDWDFGDGSPHSSAPDPTHVYATAGRRKATLTVEDGRGMTATGTVAVRTVKSKLRISHVVARLGSKSTLAGSFTSTGPVRRLEVELWLEKPRTGSCSWWSVRARSLKHGNCTGHHFARASLGHTDGPYTWTLDLRRRPPPGSYALVLQTLPRSDSAFTRSDPVTRHLRVK